jgi:hypothetical protein
MTPQQAMQMFHHTADLEMWSINDMPLQDGISELSNIPPD